MPPAQILIVEDERIIAAELTRRITRLGYVVVATVGSGAEAIERARVSCPDLVLMDVGLPGEMDGLEAGARIWEELKIPIVMSRRMRMSRRWRRQEPPARARRPQAV